MIETQLNLFDFAESQNPLSNKRVCLCGTFSINNKDLNAMLRAVGVANIDSVSGTKTFKEGENVFPVKETTDFFIVGSNPNQECLKRYDFNAHDGFHAHKITEEKMMDLLRGNFDIDEFSERISKHLDLTYSYYCWDPPVINGKEFVSRTSSPLNYYEKNVLNPISEKELYIPEIDGVNMNALRQIVGNFGGYANMYFDANTFVIMLGDETINKWKIGIKDDTILEIEEKYNKSDSKSFNICFTSLSEFLQWVKKRLAQSYDPVTAKLVDAVYKTNSITLQ